MKRTLALLLMIGTMLGVASPAFAERLGDWRIKTWDPVEEVYIDMNIPARATSTNALFGGEVGHHKGAWYNFGSGFFNIVPVLGAYGESTEYRIGIDPGYINIMDINGAFDEFESKLDISAFNTGMDAMETFVLTQGGTNMQSDWTQASTTALDYVKNKPTLDRVYDGTTLRSNSFELYKSATVASGNAVFQLTSDNTSGGTALCTNGVILDSLQLRAEEGTTPHAFGVAAMSNSNKTLTVPVSKLGSVLGILSVNQSANGTTVKANITCY